MLSFWQINGDGLLRRSRGRRDVKMEVLIKLEAGMGGNAEIGDKRIS